MSTLGITAVGILLPLLGTILGAAFVFFVKRQVGEMLYTLLNSFAAGVMVAASVWSLLIPAVEMTTLTGVGRILPAVGGLAVGVLGLLLLNCREERRAREEARTATGTRLSVIAIILHNIPEGMAVGVVYAGLLDGASVLPAEALILSLGIAAQNLPEGAIVSLPLRSEGLSRGRAFLIGACSGVVEPLGALLTILLTALFLPILPFLLAFAAGAMLYVVYSELIPESQAGGYPCIGALGFTGGFSLMMVLDILLG